MKELQLEEPPDAPPPATDWVRWDPAASFPHITIDDSYHLTGPNIVETKSNDPPILSEAQPLSDLMNPQLFNVSVDAFILPSAELPQWPLMNHIASGFPGMFDEFDPNHFAGPAIFGTALDILPLDFQQPQLRYFRDRQFTKLVAKKQRPHWIRVWTTSLYPRSRIRIWIPRFGAGKRIRFHGFNEVEKDAPP
jgi:hypothetical protein